MPMSNRIYRPGEKPHAVFDQSKGVNAFNQFFYVKMGTILNVDYDRYVMDVLWINQNGARSHVPISFAYAGPAGCMGMVPEIGALGIFGFYDEGGGKGAPLLLSYLPSGLAVGLDQNVVKIEPDQIPTEDVNEILHRFKRIKEGDMICHSPKGSFLLINNSINLTNSSGSSLLIRESDQSIILTSIGHHMFADGASISCGPAVRNGLTLYDASGKKIEDLAASIITGSDGKERVYMVPYGEDPDDIQTSYYTEYRIDVDEHSRGSLDINNVNNDSPMSMRDPIVSMIMGNYIGADDTDPVTYGRVLRPVLFKDSKDIEGGFDLAACAQNAGLDENARIGLAWAMHFLKSNTFMGVDKEGHYHVALSASGPANPLGSGRSMSMLGQGSLKEIWGMESSSGNSWDLATKGGVIWALGAHTTGSRHSIDIGTDSSWNLEVGAPDADGFGKQENISGNVVENIGGNKSFSVTDHNLTIKGMKVENVQGAVSETTQSDKTVNVQGVYTESVVSEKQCKFGKRKTNINTGNDELIILKGDLTETIQTFGKRKCSISVGNIEESILTGDRKTEITAGNYKVKVSVGGIEIKNSMGTISINAAGMVTIKGSIMVKVDAPIVKVGKGAPLGGAITGLPGTSISHYDYMSGAPLKGSAKVGIA